MKKILPRVIISLFLLAMGIVVGAFSHLEIMPADVFFTLLNGSANYSVLLAASWVFMVFAGFCVGGFFAYLVCADIIECQDEEIERMRRRVNEVRAVLTHGVGSGAASFQGVGQKLGSPLYDGTASYVDPKDPGLTARN